MRQAQQEEIFNEVENEFIDIKQTPKEDEKTELLGGGEMESQEMNDQISEEIFLNQ